MIRCRADHRPFTGPKGRNPSQQALLGHVCSCIPSRNSFRACRSSVTEKLLSATEATPVQTHTHPKCVHRASGLVLTRHSDKDGSAGIGNEKPLLSRVPSGPPRASGLNESCHPHPPNPPETPGPIKPPPSQTHELPSLHFSRRAPFLQFDPIPPRTRNRVQPRLTQSRSASKSKALS